MRRSIWGVGVGAAAAAGYALWVRPWTHRWGATDGELARDYPGDDLVEHPNYQATLAITVRAHPEELWPWLMQMGNGRGGLYSYDWLDRLFGVLDHDSARVLLPGLGELRPGDAVPCGHDPKGFFPVRQVERNRALVLGGTDAATGLLWSWTFILVPQGERTRLLSRNRVLVPPRLTSRLALAGIEPTAFLMTRKMLLTLRDRAETLALARAFSTAEAAPVPTLLPPHPV